MQTPTALQHVRGLRFSHSRPVPFVTRLFTGLERRRASDSLVGKDVDGIESPPCSGYYPADLLELEWIRNANGLEKL